jgi:UDP-glucose 4-epimerase
MATLVTGAGLLGASFAEVAIARGERIYFFDPEPRAAFLRQKLGEGGYQLIRGDVRSLPDLVEAIATHRVQTLVHTAGLIGGRVQREISQAFDINVIGTRNVAEAARLAGVKRIVHLSTFGVYDWRRPLPGAITEDFPLGPGRAYGNFKIAKEMVLEAYAAQFRIELIILRPANVFGAGHFWGGSSGGARMQELMKAALAGRPARLAAADAADVEYVYAKDVGAAIDLAATVPASRERVFNIGSGQVTRFDDLIAAIRHVHPKLELELEPGDRPKTKSKPLDISLAQKHLGWSPRFSLIEALTDYHADLSSGHNAQT